jgi:hypothetical protein
MKTKTETNIKTKVKCKVPIPTPYTGIAFVGCYNGVTFGADDEGNCFDTLSPKVLDEDKVRCARINAKYCTDLAKKLQIYADLLEGK